MSKTTRAQICNDRECAAMTRRENTRSLGSQSRCDKKCGQRRSIASKRRVIAAALQNCERRRLSSTKSGARFFCARAAADKNVGDASACRRCRRRPLRCSSALHERARAQEKYRALVAGVLSPAAVLDDARQAQEARARDNKRGTWRPPMSQTIDDGDYKRARADEDAARETRTCNIQSVVVDTRDRACCPTASVGRSVGTQSRLAMRVRGSLPFRACLLTRSLACSIGGELVAADERARRRRRCSRQLRRRRRRRRRHCRRRASSWVDRSPLTRPLRSNCACARASLSEQRREARDS